MLTSSMGLGGAETHILTLCNELARRGHGIFLFSRGGELEGALAPAIRRGRIRGFLTPSAAFSSYRQLLTLCRKEDFDLIHGHTREVNLFADLLSRQTGIPFVSTVHWTFSLSQPKKILTRWGQAALAVSPDIKAYLITKYAYPADLAACTVNGIDTELFRSHGKKERELIHVSRLDPGRDLCARLLLECAEELFSSGLYRRLLIIGGGASEGELRRTAEAINRKIGHPFIGMPGGQKDIAPYLGGGAYFVGVSRAALEAMAAECRIILCGDEGYAGIFSPEGSEGLIESNFCCRNYPAPTKGRLLADLYRLPSSADGRRNRDFIKTHYTVKRMADDAEGMYAFLPPKREKTSPRALLCGYYGYRNLGDEALLSVLAARLSFGGYRVTALSRTPRKTKKAGVNAIYRFSPLRVLISLLKADVFILGGGNLLQNESSDRSLLYYASLARLAKLLGKPCILASIGIGPYYGKYAKKTIQKILDSSDAVLPRTHKDLQRAALLSAGADLRFSPDAALFLPFWERTEKSTPAAIALSVKQAGLPEELLLRLEAKGYSLFFLLMNPADRKAAEATAHGRPVLSPASPGEALRLLSSASLAIGERLHFSIFAFRVGVPFLTLDESPKMQDFCQELELAAKRSGSRNTEGIYAVGSKKEAPDSLFEKAETLLSFPDRQKKYEAVYKTLLL